MATRLAGNTINDLRVLKVNNDAKDRKVKIALFKKEDEIGREKFRMTQEQLYPNLIQVTPETTLQQIITEQNERLAQDMEQQYQIAERNLLTIADKQNAEYMLDHLEDEEIRYMNSKFDYLVSQLKAQYTNVNKLIFINYVKQKYVADLASVDNREHISFNEDIPFASQRGHQNMVMKAQMKDDLEQQLEEQNRKAQEQINRQHQQHRQNLRMNEAATAIQRASQSRKYRIQQQEQQEQQQRQEQEQMRMNEAARVIQRVSKNRQDRQNRIRQQQQLLTPTQQHQMQQIDDILIRRGLHNEISDETLKKINEVLLSAKRNRNNNKNQSFVSPLHLEEEVMTPVKTPARPRGRPRKEPLNPVETGHGLTKKRIIKGKGLVTKTSSKRLLNGGKFQIDMEKLNNNILSIKYTKNNATIPALRPERISNDVKALIKDILDTHFNHTFFDKLNDTDKRMVKRFVKTAKIPIEINDKDDEEFQKRFEIIKGEIMSGNDNKDLRNEMKMYILQAIKENLISRHDALMLFYQLSL